MRGLWWLTRGLLLAGTVMDRLGLEALIDETVRLDGREAGSGSGRKVLTLVASMLVGGRCIDDTDRLRAGASQAVLPFRVMAPSTVGSFLRSFTFGHVRQFDKAAEAGAGAGVVCGRAPAAGEMTVDLDSTVCEVCGKAKHGWLACCVLAHNLMRWIARLGRVHPARQSHRRGHHPQPAPRRARPPRQPQRPPQTPPPVPLALGRGPHHSAGTHPQPAPAHLTSR